MMASRQVATESRVESCANGLLWTAIGFCIGAIALLITVLCSYSGDRTIIHHIPWAQLVISPAEDGSSSQDFGRHIYFGLRFISVDGNPSTEGRYEYGVESRDSAYFRNDGKITNPGSGGSGAPLNTCETILDDVGELACRSCNNASEGTFVFLAVSLLFTLVALGFTSHRVLEGGNTLYATASAGTFAFLSFVCSLIGMLWFYEKCIETVAQPLHGTHDGKVNGYLMNVQEDVAFYLCVVIISVQLLVTLIQLLVPPWYTQWDTEQIRIPPSLPPQHNQGTPEFWDVINNGGHSNQQISGPIQGRPHVIYTNGAPPNVGTNLGGVGRPQNEWYNSNGGNAAHYITNSAPPMSYPQAAPAQFVYVGGGGNQSPHYSRAYVGGDGPQQQPGFVREYVL